MVYKMVTSKSVIAKVIADLGLEESKINISDISEWIGEGAQKIGAVTQRNRKVAVSQFEGYQCKLPCDLTSIDFVSYSDDGQIWTPIKKSTGAFSTTDKDAESNDIIQENGDNILIEKYDKQVIKNTKRGTVEYDIKPGYIMFNIESGYVKIAYFAEYTDEDGMPLIPDLPSYFEAIYWYVAMKLLFKEYVAGRKPQYLYYDAKRSWNFYRNQAYSEAMMPNSNEMESIKNTWHTLVPEVNEFDTEFKHIGDKQIIYNWN